MLKGVMLAIVQGFSRNFVDLLHYPIILTFYFSHESKLELPLLTGDSVLLITRNDLTFTLLGYCEIVMPWLPFIAMQRKSKFTTTRTEAIHFQWDDSRSEDLVFGCISQRK